MAGFSAESDVRSLEREAEALRARLHDTIAQIRDPDTLENAKREMKQRAAQAKEKMVGYMRDARDNAFQSGTSFTHNLQRQAFDHPLPVALICAGLGWRLYKKPPVAAALIGAGLWSMMKTWDTTNAMHGSSQSGRGAPSFDAQNHPQAGLFLALAGAGLLSGLLLRNADTMRHWMESTREPFDEKTKDLPAIVPQKPDLVESVRHDVKHSAEELRDRGAEYLRQAKETGAEHPLLLSVMGLVAGALIGGMIRQTSLERNALMPVAENMRMRAGTVAEKIAESLAGPSAQMQSQPQAHRREPVTA
jgi:hypothetical protein